MRKILVPLLALMLGSACSTNLFEPVADPDPADKASAALDERKFDEAISVLEDALQNEPENWLYVSLLASAKAQKAGVDTTDIALEMVTGGETSGNPLTALFTILPAPTLDVIDLLGEATGLLASIPAEEVTSGDAFKISMFNTAFTALQAKYFDADGSGALSPEELLSMDEESAISILNSLLNAENAAAAYQSAGGDGEATGSVSQIRSKIDAQPGTTQLEKLRNYLGSGS